MSTDSEVVLYEVNKGVALITLNRPERKNAWNMAMEASYFSLLDQANKSDEVRVIVITGAGGAFCPGRDMEELREIAASGDGLIRGDRLPIETPMKFPKPMIAAIPGACAGLGLLHALMCDIRFIVPRARLSTSFARRGLSAEYMAAWILPRMVGTENAMDLLLSGRTFNGDEAHRLGMASRLCEPDDLLPSALAYAEDLAANCSPMAMAAIRQQVNGYLDMSMDDALVHSLKLMDFYNKTDDFVEGIASFVERRTPNFSPWEPLPKGSDPSGLVP